MSAAGRTLNAVSLPERNPFYTSRGLFRRSVPSRGGQLEIAGVVVGSWGPNYGSRNVPSAGAFPAPRPNNRIVPPQVIF